MTEQQAIDSGKEHWVRRAALWLIWLGFICYNPWLAPVDRHHDIV